MASSSSGKSSSKLRLEWHDHSGELMGLARELCGQSELTDVTLSCAGGVTFSAHRMVLAGASTYFRSTFQALETWKHPVIFLKDVKASDMEYFLQFIYYGEVSVPSHELENIVAIARELGIKGLDSVGVGAGGEADDDDEDYDEAPLSKRRKAIRPGPASAKRKMESRRSDGEPGGKRTAVRVKEEEHGSAATVEESYLEQHQGDDPLDEEAYDDDDYGGGGGQDDDYDEDEMAARAPASGSGKKKSGEEEDDEYFPPGAPRSGSKKKKKRNYQRKNPPHSWDIGGFAWGRKKPRKVMEAVGDGATLYPGDVGDQVVEVIKTQYGGYKIAMNGFLYACNQERSDRRYWRCLDKSCTGSATTDVHMLAGEAKKPHLHPPDHHSVEYNKFNARLKEAALTSDKPPRLVYEEVVPGVHPRVMEMLPPRKRLLEKITKMRQLERERQHKMKTDPDFFQKRRLGPFPKISKEEEELDEADRIRREEARRRVMEEDGVVDDDYHEEEVEGKVEEVGEDEEQVQQEQHVLQQQQQQQQQQHQS